MAVEDGAQPRRVQLDRAQSRDRVAQIDRDQLIAREPEGDDDRRHRGDDGPANVKRLAEQRAIATRPIQPECPHRIQRHGHHDVGQGLAEDGRGIVGQGLAQLPVPREPGGVAGGQRDQTVGGAEQDHKELVLLFDHAGAAPDRV